MKIFENIKKNGRIFHFALSFILTAIFLIIILTWLGTEQIIDVFCKLGWTDFLWLFFIYQGTQVLRTCRMSLQLPETTKPGFLSLFGVISVHQLFNHLLPARLGEFSFPFLLKRCSEVAPATAMAILIFVRLQEIFVLLLFVLISILTLASSSNAIGLTLGNKQPYLLGIVLFLLIFITLFRIFLPFFIKSIISLFEILKKKFSWKPGVIFLNKIQKFTLSLQEGFSLPVSRSRRAMFFFLTALIWMNTFFFFHEILRMSGILLQFNQTIAGASLANFSQALPLNTFGSFGSLELGWTVGFSLLGIEIKTALAVGMSMHLLVLTFLLFSGVLSWLFLPTKKAADSPSLKKSLQEEKSSDENLSLTKP